MTTALLTIEVPSGTKPEEAQAVAGDHLMDKGFSVHPTTPAEIRARVTLEGKDAVAYLKQATKKVVAQAADELYASGEDVDVDAAYDWLRAYFEKNDDLSIVWSVVALLDPATGVGDDPTENLPDRLAGALSLQVEEEWARLEEEADARVQERLRRARERRTP